MVDVDYEEGKELIEPYWELIHKELDELKDRWNKRTGTDYKQWHDLTGVMLNHFPVHGLVFDDPDKIH